MSDFSLQILHDILKLIKQFSEDYKDIFSLPIITVPSSAFGIYLANLLLKAKDNHKERKETAILFRNAIKSHVRDLGHVNLYTSSGYIQNKEIIELYQSKFDDNELFVTAFKKVGIYKSKEIELISQYYVSLKESLNHLTRLFLANDKNQKNTRFAIVRISITTTLVYGLLCNYSLGYRYSREKHSELKKNYLSDYYQIINELKEEFNYNKSLYIINNTLCKDFIFKLEFARNIYQEINKYNFNIKRESIYICRAILNRDITTVDTSTKKLVVVILNKDNIVMFGKTKEEATKNCQDRFRYFLNNSNNQLSQNFPTATKLTQNKIDKLIEETKYEVHIVSP